LSREKSRKKVLEEAVLFELATVKSDALKQSGESARYTSRQRTPRGNACIGAYTLRQFIQNNVGFIIGPS
jgi:hypothetical protein